MLNPQLISAFSIPQNFKINEVATSNLGRLIGQVSPPLGPIAAFAGTFTGTGFNTIFRPNSSATPTKLPHPEGGDNVLELNLTQETLSFNTPLDNIPNRGFGAQADIFLNGVPYVQTINDVTFPNQSTGIHFEPGIWLHVPSTTHPAEHDTVVRMASIPHGVTIVAQGTTTTTSGKPNIPAVDITPFAINPPHGKVPFPSQTASNGNTARIPQDLGPFISAGTITQAILTDPNSILRNHIASQTIVSTRTIQIDTAPGTPLFGGGTDNIALLLGDAAGSTPNANAIRMVATFWVETVEHIIHIPVIVPGHPPIVLPAAAATPGGPVPHFLIQPPHPITAPISIKVHATQIQYSQTVFLNFGPLTWPHVSVATLVPNGAIGVPPSAWA